MQSRPRTRKKTRVRRTAEDAREAILDAAERRLVATGPSGIRLQEVAEDVGVSHPTILHHFGSRDRLVDAVVKRRIDAMNADVLRVLTTDPEDENLMLTLFERLGVTLGAGGHARTLAFLALEGWPEMSREGILPLAALLHENRVVRTAPGEPLPPLSDSYYAVLLVSFALFGEAIVGALFRGAPESVPEGTSPEAFRVWLVSLLREHLEAGIARPSGASGSTRLPADG